jgi:hypothetical protein
MFKALAGWWKSIVTSIFGEDTHKIMTEEELLKLTKEEIDAMALEKFGIQLDRRKTKKRMIRDFYTELGL